jgi:hypothetical protein
MAHEFKQSGYPGQAGLASKPGQLGKALFN